MSGHDLIPVSAAGDEDKELIAKFVDVAKLTGRLVDAEPIKRPRPNEVGNDIELFVIKAANQLRLNATRPETKDGKKKSTGYPDILILDRFGRYTYVDCKVYANGTEATTMRSFYLSPSENFKVSRDARHLLLAFGYESESINNSSNSFYRVRSYKLVDLYGLKCDVKYEFNSDNQRLYEDRHILAHGEI
jgi:hypothetical protein